MTCKVKFKSCSKVERKAVQKQLNRCRSSKESITIIKTNSSRPTPIFRQWQADSRGLKSKGKARGTTITVRATRELRVTLEKGMEVRKEFLIWRGTRRNKRDQSSLSC